MVAAASSWEGEWNTTWGKMTLKQIEKNVTGTYAYKDGRIDAQVVGNKIIGNWYQSNGSGQIEFEMDSDRAGFHGKWKYANKASWNNTWTGKRL
jgi:hypothetical protein